MVEVDAKTKADLRRRFVTGGIAMVLILIGAAVAGFLVSVKAAQPIRTGFLTAEHSARQAVYAQNIAHLLGQLTDPKKLRTFFEFRNDLTHSLDMLVTGNLNLFAGNTEIGLPPAEEDVRRMIFLAPENGLMDMVKTLEKEVRDKFINDVASADEDDARALMHMIQYDLTPRLMELADFYANRAQIRINLFVFFQVISLAIAVIAAVLVWALFHVRLNMLVQKTLTPEVDDAQNPVTRNYGTSSGLPNMNYLRDVMMDETMLLKNTESIAVVVHIRLTGFDTLGVSDDVRTRRAVQRDLYQRIRGLLREGDFLALINENTFVLSIGSLTHPDQAMPTIRAVLGLFAETYRFADVSGDLAPSIGVEILTKSDRTPEKAINSAAGIQKACAQFGLFPILAANRVWPKNKKLLETVRNGLEKGLESGAVGAVFLPVNNSRARRIDRMQARAFWNHPKAGPINPIYVQAMAESTEMQHLVNERVIQETCSALVQWDQEAMQIEYASLYLSKSAVLDTRTLEHMRWNLDETGLTPDRLAIEVDDFLLALPEISEQIVRYAEFGVTIFARDHGCEDFDLSQRRKNGIEGLILPRNAVANIESNPTRRRLTLAKIRHAGKFNSPLIIEDVITEGEYNTLSHLGGELIQGPYFSGEMTSQDLIRLLSRSGQNSGVVNR